jgi:adenylate cyclase
MWALTLRSPDGKPREYTIRSPKVTIGRRADNDIVIADISASRLHAEIEYNAQDDSLVIKDLGSTNGTFVNRIRLTEPRRLEHRDVIRIGECVISVTRYHTGEQMKPGPPATHPLTRDVVLESIDQHAVLMYEIASKLNSILDLETALQEVSSMLRRSLGAEKCEVILADQFSKLGEMGFPSSIANMVIEKRSAVVIPDLASVEESRFGKSAFLFRVRSVLCVPVIGGDELLGLVYMYKTDPQERPFDQRDLQLAVAVSHQTALTIQRMRLLERVQEEQRIRQLLQRFVSPAEANFISREYLRSGRLPELAERMVTVLFADIADSTGMAERLGPTRFGQILARYYQEMTNVIFNQGGMVDKFLGDGIMAVFGMTGDRHDPEGRAVKAGLMMLDALDEMNRDLEEPIQIGIGVNTGLVVAGYVGTKQQVELTVVGDTVNVAAGLQNMARPNRLLVGPATVAAIVGRFPTQRVGAVVVKGRTRRIQAHEVLRESLI